MNNYDDDLLDKIKYGDYIFINFPLSIVETLLILHISYVSYKNDL